MWKKDWRRRKNCWRGEIGGEDKKIEGEKIIEKGRISYRIGGGLE